MGSSGAMSEKGAQPMDTEIYSILARAIELEAETPRKSFKERIETCLEAWQWLGVCSFATAFEIEGNSIRLDENNNPLIYNRLPNDESAEWGAFSKLTAVPGSGLGKWPWEILREKAREENKREGLFPAELRSLSVSASPLI